MKDFINLIFLVLFVETFTLCAFVNVYGFNPGFYLGAIYNIIMTSHMNIFHK